MATVRIERRWPDGDALIISIRSDAEHPDGWDMAATRALRLFAESMDVAVEVVDGDVEDDD